MSFATASNTAAASPRRRHPTRGDAARVLIIHHVSSTVARDVARVLSRVGYRVAVATIAGAQERALDSAPDVIVTVNAVPPLPAQLLRRRLVTLAVESAADDAVEAVDEALAASFAILTSLHEADSEVSAPFADIDIGSLMHGACETHRCAALSASDGTRVVRISFLEGLLADAEVRDTSDRSGKRIESGLPALLAFLACSAVEGASFSFAPLAKHPPRLLWMSWAAVEAKLADAHAAAAAAAAAAAGSASLLRQA